MNVHKQFGQFIKFIWRQKEDIAELVDDNEKE